MLATSKLKLEGYPDKTLTNPYAFYVDNGDSVVLIALGDPSGNRYTTYIQTVIYHEWIDYMIEENITKVDFAPFTIVYSLQFFEGYGETIIKMCSIALSVFRDDGFSEGKLEVCHDKNEYFAPDEYFRSGFNASLTTDKYELMQMFEVYDEEDLCSCQQGSDIVDCPEEE